MRDAFRPRPETRTSLHIPVPLEEELPFAGIASNGRIWEESEFVALPIQNKCKVALAPVSVAYLGALPLILKLKCVDDMR